MEIKYQLFEQEYLLIQKFTGLFSPEYYLRYTGHLAKDLSSKTIKKVLIDFRDLIFSETNDKMPDDFNEKLDRIIEIRRAINQKEHINKDTLLVIWVDKPLPTVIAHLFIDNFTEMNYKYCSTSSKAIEILKLKSNFDDLERIVNNLDHTFKNI
jgi:hypothetical protein